MMVKRIASRVQRYISCGTFNEADNVASTGSDCPCVTLRKAVNSLIFVDDRALPTKVKSDLLEVVDGFR